MAALVNSPDIRPLSPTFRIELKQANARPRVSVTGSDDISTRYRRLGYDGLLLVSGQFLLNLFGIEELAPGFTSRIEPLHERIRPSSFLFRQCHHRVRGWLSALG